MPLPTIRSHNPYMQVKANSKNKYKDNYKNNYKRKYKNMNKY